jgi:putative membrane protein
MMRPVTERGPEPPGEAADEETRDAMRRTQLANERTYLAWWRTGLTALAVSLAAGRVVPTLSHGTAWPYELAGAGFAVLGVLCIYTGFQREREIDRALEEGRFATLDPRMNFILTTVGVVLGLFTLGLIVVHP